MLHCDELWWVIEMGWEVKEFPNELVVMNENEKYHVYKRMKFEPLPNSETLYEAFRSHYMGIWWDESIFKTFFAPLRGKYRMADGSNVSVGMYRITPEGEIIPNESDNSLNYIEDIVKLPGSNLPVKTREWLLKNNFYIELMYKKYLKESQSGVMFQEPVDVELITDGTNVFQIQYDGNGEPVIYDVFDDCLVNKDIEVVMRDYIGLATNWNEFIKVSSKVAIFGKKFYGGMVLVKKRIGFGMSTIVEVKPDFTNSGFRLERFGMDFIEAVTLVKSMNSIKEVGLFDVMR